MPALRPFALLGLLVAALLAPAVTADPLVRSTCAEQDLGPATLSACTPTVPSCLLLAVGDGGFVSLCLDDLAGGSEDADGDGWTAADGDCDDGDPSVFPGASEAPNGIDDDCDGQVDEGLDQDADGFSIPEDCDDSDSSISPAGVESADRRDNDCDGVADEGFQDSNDFDADGVTLDGGDCDDTDGASFPGATEIADRKDNDCNGFAEA